MRIKYLILLLGILSIHGFAFASAIDGRLSLDSIRSECISFSKIKVGSSGGDARECKISEFDKIGEIEGTNYFYALYCLMPKDSPESSDCGDGSFDARYHRNRGVAVFSSVRDSKSATLLFERADPEIGITFYEKPEIVDFEKNKILLLPIRVDGTGAGNISEYFLLENKKWNQIESEEWEKRVREQIPKGLRISKGIWPDLKNMNATAGLYKEGDANCCPTGGQALIDLFIKDKQIRIKKLIIEPAVGSK